MHHWEIYANKLKDITKIKDGGEIAIPNDPTNGGRALILLQTAGLIKLICETATTDCQ